MHCGLSVKINMREKPGTHFVCVCFHVRGQQKPKYPQLELQGWRRHYTGRYRNIGISGLYLWRAHSFLGHVVCTFNISFTPSMLEDELYAQSPWRSVPVNEPITLVWEWRNRSHRFDDIHGIEVNTHTLTWYIHNSSLSQLCTVYVLIPLNQQMINLQPRLDHACEFHQPICLQSSHHTIQNHNRL